MFLLLDFLPSEIEKSSYLNSIIVIFWNSNWMKFELFKIQITGIQTESVTANFGDFLQTLVWYNILSIISTIFLRVIISLNRYIDFHIISHSHSNNPNFLHSSVYHCCDEMSDKINLKEERFVLVHGFRLRFMVGCPLCFKTGSEAVYNGKREQWTKEAGLMVARSREREGVKSCFKTPSPQYSPLPRRPQCLKFLPPTTDDICLSLE